MLGPGLAFVTAPELAQLLARVLALALVLTPVLVPTVVLVLTVVLVAEPMAPGPSGPPVPRLPVQWEPMAWLGLSRSVV